MKLILSLVIFLGSHTLIAQDAGFFHCQSLPERPEADRVVVDGRLERVSNSQLLMNYSLEYNSYHCEQLTWPCSHRERMSGSGLLNNRGYRPWVHMDSLQFILMARYYPLARDESISLLLARGALDHGTKTWEGFLMTSHMPSTFGETIPLSCTTVAEQPHAAASPASPSDELSRSRKILSEDFGWPLLRLSMNLPPQGESIPAVSASKALMQGLGEMLEDLSSSETPLVIAANGWALEHHEEKLSFPLTQAAKLAVQNYLRSHLNRPSTELMLWNGPEEEGFPPEHGENTDENWIFRLEIPSLSDHLYWIIVDKAGIRRSYVYGFN